MFRKHNITQFVITVLLLIYTIHGYGMQNNTEVEDVVVKFSYLGAQNKSVTSLLFSINDINNLADKFAAHNVWYINDKTLLIPLHTTILEQENIVNTVKLLQAEPVNPELSVVLLNTKKDTATEYKLNRKQASQFYSKIADIIKSNLKIVEAVVNWGNATGFSTQ